MKSSLEFSLNGISSKNMGVVNVHETTGLFHEQLSTPFLLEYNVQESTGKVASGHYKLQPFEFTLHLYFELRNQAQLRVLVQWLYQKEFVELMFHDFPHRMLLVKTVQIGELQHNGLNNGIIPVTFVSHAPYFVSKLERTNPTRVQTSFGGKDIYLLNEGDVELSPIIRFELDGYLSPMDRYVSINNVSNGTTMRIEKVEANDKIFIDGERKIIHSSRDRVGSYAGSQHDGSWISLSPSDFTDTTINNGMNHLNIEGEGYVQFEYRHKYYTL